MNGRTWRRDELERILELLAEGGHIHNLAVELDRTPEAVLFRASKLLKNGRTF